MLNSSHKIAWLMLNNDLNIYTLFNPIFLLTIKLIIVIIKNNKFIPMLYFTLLQSKTEKFFYKKFYFTYIIQIG